MGHIDPYCLRDDINISREFLDSPPPPVHTKSWAPKTCQKVVKSTIFWPAKPVTTLVTKKTSFWRPRKSHRQKFVKSWNLSDWRPKPVILTVFWQPWRPAGFCVYILTAIWKDREFPRNFYMLPIYRSSMISSLYDYVELTNVHIMECYVWLHFQ